MMAPNPTKPRHVGRFLKALAAAGGAMDRTELSRKTFGGNYTKTQLSEIADAGVLLGYVMVVTRRIRKNGRIVARYSLTPSGRTFAKLWSLPTTTDKLPYEEVQRQFELLAADSNLWAMNLAKDAQSWRNHVEEQKRLRKEKADREAAKKAEWERLHPQPKNPSAGRHRSPKEIADRKAWLASKIASQAAPPPRRPVLPPARPIVEEFNGNASRYGGGFTPRPTVPVAPQRLQSNASDGVYHSGKTMALIRKISAAGYQHAIGEDGLIRHGNERLTPEEWMRRNPGVISD